MNRQPSVFRPGEPRESPGFDERRARYVFLSELIEGAQVVELLPPESAGEPGARFLESLGAASAVSVCCTASSPPTPEVLDGIAARSGGETPLFVVEDGLAWASDEAALDALLREVQVRLAFAQFLFVFRSAGGASLSSFGSRGNAALGTARSRFDFAGTDRLLRQKFASVRFATQCALWGCQLAPLDGAGDDWALDGTLLDGGGRAAFFLALCAPERTRFPSELTVVPIPLHALARSAGRFDRLAEELQRSEAVRAHLEASLRQRELEADRVQALASQAEAAERERDAAEEGRLKAEAQLKRAGTLLDELAAERAGLVARLEKAEEGLRRAEASRDEERRLRESAAAACGQAEREREAHLALSREALEKLQTKFGAVQAENERLRAAAQAAEAGGRGKKKSVPSRGAKEEAGAGQDQEIARRDQRIAELEKALAEGERRAARLDALVQKQDQKIESLEKAERERDSLAAGCSISEAEKSALEAQLAERGLRLESLAQDLRELGRAVDTLERRRNGEAIEALLDLYASIREDLPEAGADGADEDGGRDEDEEEQDF